MTELLLISPIDPKFSMFSDADLIWFSIWFFNILIAPDTINESWVMSCDCNVVCPSTFKSPFIMTEPVTCRSLVDDQYEPELPHTKSSCLAIGNSLPSWPAIHWSFVASHNKEPYTVLGFTVSLILNPPKLDSLPFNSIILSLTITVSDNDEVTVPCTVKSPVKSKDPLICMSFVVA